MTAFLITSIGSLRPKVQALVLVVMLCLLTVSLVPGEDTDENEDMEVFSTGSRVTQQLGEIAGQVVILDEEDIRATGEQTLERVLRQLPQNLNPTTERYGSNLNNVTNFTSGSTVNLRGLGSESTLVLVDGKRSGHNGILGGVTDVSSIPLNQVERIEIVLDGASAVYGSGAVGGVVNILTKKEFEGIEITAEYGSPTTPGYHENRFGIRFSREYSSMVFRFSYQQSMHSGLDASDRSEVTIFDSSRFPGPQFDVRFCCSSDGTGMPIAYELDGRILSVPEYQALSFRPFASPITHAILPAGFNESSSIDVITNFSEPDWGADARDGITVLPDVRNHSLALGVQWGNDDTWSGNAYFRQTDRSVWKKRGYISFHGETLNGNSPYNPFQTSVHLRGQRRDYPQPFTETYAELGASGFEVKGKISDRVILEASVSQSSEDVLTFQHFEVDRTRLSQGMYSDGVNPVYSLLVSYIKTRDQCEAGGGTWVSSGWVNGSLRRNLCCVRGGVLSAVNPFGDISQFISNYPLEATSFNRIFQLEGIIRAKLFTVPAGSVFAIFGVSRHTTDLQGFTEFPLGISNGFGIRDITQFHAEVQRTNSAIFAEGMLPLVSRENEQMWAQRLTLHLSVRNDIYDGLKGNYLSATATNSSPSRLVAPNSESTWGLGLIWVPMETVTVKYNQQSAFVAPPLSQLLREARRSPSPPFQGIWLKQPDGFFKRQPLTIVQGGNPNLSAETADSRSIGVTFSPNALPDLSVNVTWNKLQYRNRINRLENFIVDPENLPSDISYVAETDEYVQQRRWINVSAVARDGVDFTGRWSLSTTNLGDFDFRVRHSFINSYDYVVDPKDSENRRDISVVGETDGTTTMGVVSRHSSNINLGWYYRGIQLNVDVTSRSRTKTILSGVTRAYQPPTLVDLRLSYHILPDGFFTLPRLFENGRITLVVNNTFDEYGETVITNSAAELLLPNDQDASPLYGRVLNFSVYFPL